MKNTILFSIIILLSACNYKSQGYLEQRPKSPLSETSALPRHKSPLEVIARQSTEISKLKKQNRIVTEKLQTLQSQRGISKRRLENLEEEVERLKKENIYLAKELRKLQNINRVQKRKIIALNIDKIKKEQEILKLKIRLLQEEE